MLFSFNEIIGQTFKLILVSPRRNYAGKCDYLLYVPSSRLLDLTIKVKLSMTYLQKYALFKKTDWAYIT